MQARICSLTLALTLCGTVLSPASAAFINFEDAPVRVTNPDNKAVGNAYSSSEGVTFSGGVFEESGDSDAIAGFLNDQAGARDVETGTNTPGLGDWFLRTEGEIGERGGPGIYLTISYSSPTEEASGQIWDIDGNTSLGTEKWEINARDGGATGTIVETDTSPLGSDNGAGSLDGLPWEFSLVSTTSFDTLTFEFIGSKTTGVGLAFDNFNSTSSTITQVPVPASFLLLGSSLAALGLGVITRQRLRR